MRVLLIIMAFSLAAFGATIPTRRLNFRTAAAASCTPGTNTLAVSLVQNFGNTSNSVIYSLDAFTTVTNATYFLALVTTNKAYTVTNSTTPLTWWPIISTNYNVVGTPITKLQLFGAQMPQGQAGFSTVVSAANSDGNGICMSLVQVTGASQTAANGTNAVLQSVAFAVDASANPTNKFTAPGNAGLDSLIYWVADDANSSSDNAATLNWTELGEVSFNTPASGLSTYYTNSAALLTTVTNTATSRDWATILIEVLAGTNCNAGQTITDAFTRGDSSDLGVNWTTITSETSIQLLSNSAQPSSVGADCGEYYSGATWTANQSSEAAITVTGGTAGTGGGVSVRCASGARTYYRAVIDASGHWEVGWVGTGTFHSLATGTTTYSAGAVMKISIIGTTLTTTYNSVQLDSRTDSNIATGSPGISYSSSTTTCIMDNWTGIDGL